MLWDVIEKVYLKEKLNIDFFELCLSQNLYLD